MNTKLLFIMGGKPLSNTLTYKQTKQSELKAELFKTDTPHAPLILYIHGGGLIWGTRNDINDKQVRLFNDHGYHVVSIAYRLAPETKLPEIITDVQDALIWAKETLSNELDYNQENVIVMGNSAGGYLSLVTGTFPVKPKAIVSFYGYGNILGDWYQTPSTHFNKMPAVKESLVQQLIQPNEVTEAPITSRYAIYLYCRQQGSWLDYVGDPTLSTEDYRAFCPVLQVDEKYPPTMLLHGDKDEDVPYEEAIRMKEALEKHSISHELITIREGLHQFDEKMDDVQVQAAFQKVLSFLEHHVKEG